MAIVSLTRDELFDADFLAAVKNLRIVARRVPRGGRHAEHRSQDLGAGIEFRDFRPYSPGDDFRSIDWNIYRRLGRVVLRLFEELEDLPLYLVPDVSTSAFSESPPRARAGLRCALALASISLAQHDRVGIYPFADTMRRITPPKAGKGRVFELASRLAEIEPGGPTSFESSLGRLAAMRLRPGLMVIISDFFDPRGIESVKRALTALRHRLLLVQLVKDSDRNPVIQGDSRLVDCETGEGQDITVTSLVLERYREAYENFQTALASMARARQWGLMRLDVDGDVINQLAELFEAGRLEV
ncbi:MAG: DUF58 domain-containing protein [Planctomycetes bacterium]|nr:DUF58 domain-containing protein [Planctomycetota bacterium]